jgi:hypothetical protein
MTSVGEKPVPTSSETLIPKHSSLILFLLNCNLNPNPIVRSGKLASSANTDSVLPRLVFAGFGVVACYAGDTCSMVLTDDNRLFSAGLRLPGILQRDPVEGVLVGEAT